MSQNIYQHTFPNGLTLLAERMEHVRSAAVNILVPAGCAHDPPERHGVASILSDLITRGAGPRSHRELMLALDGLGVDRSESAGTLHMRFWGSTLSRHVLPTLELFADVVRRPHLPEDELDAVKALAIQEIEGLEDEPRQKVIVELKKRHFPAPLNRDRRGEIDHIEAMTIDDLRNFHRQRFNANGTIISVAGHIDWPALIDTVGRCFGDWPAGEEQPLTLGDRGSRRDQIIKDTKQTQIGVAYDTVPMTHHEYFSALGAVNVLSGGMSARLFTEVREKRGLCYAVWATYQSYRDRACILAYAGTTTERAQETLDVTIGELRRLEQGIEPDEVQRVQAGLKSSLIMQEESTSARAGTIASDWYYFGRVRPLEEIQAAADALTPANIVDFVRRYPARDFTVVTLGPKPLDLRACDADATHGAEPPVNLASAGTVN